MVCLLAVMPLGLSVRSELAKLLAKTNTRNSSTDSMNHLSDSMSCSPVKIATFAEQKATMYELQSDSPRFLQA